MPSAWTVVWIVAGSVLVVLACLAMTWWIIYRLNLDRRAVGQARMADIDRLLAQARAAKDEIDHEARDYPDEPPPFYRPTFARLAQSRAFTTRAIERHTRAYEKLGNRAAPVPGHPLRRIFSVLGAERRFWRDQLEQVQALEGHVRDQVVGGLAQAQELLRELRAKPLAFAQNARELRNELDQAMRIAVDLQTNGVHGETFLTQCTRLEDYRQQFDQEPIAFFVKSSEATILRQAGLHAVQQARDALSGIQEPSLATVDLLHTWQTLHYEFEQALQELQEVQHQFASRLKAIPPSIDVSSLSAAWDTHRAQVPELFALFASPTVQDLQQADLAVQIVRAGYDLIQRIAHVESRYWHLCELIQTMVTTLTRIQAIMVETSQSRAYPLAWAEYPIVFSDLATRLTQIGVIDTPRTPDRLDRDGQRAIALSQQVDARRTEIEQIVEQYRALLLRLEQPELTPDRRWFERATRLQQQCGVYASQNWPRKLAVDRLKGDIATLDKRWQRWMPATLQDQVTVSQIEQRVAQVGELGQELALFSKRLAQIESQLLAIQQSESTALAQLEQAGHILAQFEQLTAKTEPALSEPLARQRSRLSDYERSRTDHVKELERRGKDRVAHHVDRAGKWTKSWTGALTAWLDALHADVIQFEHQLEEEVARLHTIAPFDAEPLMAVARKLVGTQPPRGASRTSRRSTDAQVLPVETFIEQTRAGLQRREQLARAYGDIRHQLWTPIAKIAGQVSETRQEALDKLDALRAAVKEQNNRSAWPFPYDTGAIDALLDDAARQENRLRDNGSKVPRVSQWLTDIERQYGQIIVQAKNSLESITKKRQALDSLVGQVEAWLADLDAYRRHTDDREIARGIRTRLDQITGDLDRLQWKTRGRRPISYDELVERLNELEQKTHRAVPYGRDSDSISVSEIESRNSRGRGRRR